MTSRGPGGKIPPQGRPPQAPGVGKTAKRHDLERPATPGLQNSDLQQGDVSRLESAQRAAPIGKRTQAAARPKGSQRRAGVQRGRDQFSMEVPDPIEMAAQRGGGKIPAPSSAAKEFDPQPWMPLLMRMATSPNAGGGLTAAVSEMIASARRRPLVGQANLIDLNELDNTVRP